MQRVESERWKKLTVQNKTKIRKSNIDIGSVIDGKTILCKINLAIILYRSVNPHQIFHFIF